MCCRPIWLLNIFHTNLPPLQLPLWCFFGVFIFFSRRQLASERTSEAKASGARAEKRQRLECGAEPSGVPSALTPPSGVSCFTSTRSCSPHWPLPRSRSTRVGLFQPKVMSLARAAIAPPDLALEKIKEVAVGLLACRPVCLAQRRLQP